jgi:hypothetical protein
MTDPAFLIAITGLSLSGIVSAIRLIDWFLHTEPRALAQAWRWAAIGLFVLALPLLVGLAADQRWTEAIGLSAVVLFVFALYGPRVLGSLFARRLVPDTSGRTGYSPPDAGREAEIVQRAITVLEDYLRRTVAQSNGAYLRDARPPLARGPSPGGGNGHDTGHDASPMSEAEALQVLGLGAGAAGPEINEAHRRLMQLIHPDRGGSAYFAVKVNQAKDVLLGRGDPQHGRSPGTGPCRRRQAPSQQDFSQSKPTTEG